MTKKEGIKNNTMNDQDMRLSAVILAGGRSTRMGKDKASLNINGETFAGHLAGKFKALGINDILISADYEKVPGIRSVPDKITGKGPLCGIYSCLLSAENPSCFVISVDSPLIREETVLEMYRLHKKEGRSITVLKHGDILEPLIGIYDKTILPLAGEILLSEKTSVKRLMDRSDYTVYEYAGDERYVSNCNTPGEYEKLIDEK